MTRDAAWVALAGRTLPGSRRRDLLVGRALLPGLTLLAFVRYLPALADAMSSAPQEQGYLAGPAFFWAIALLDLGVFLPATIVACVGLVRGAPWARTAQYTVVGWFALVGPAVASMALTMWANDDPTASGAGTVVAIALGALFLVLAATLLRPLLDTKGAPR